MLLGKSLESLEWAKCTYNYLSGWGQDATGLTSALSSSGSVCLTAQGSSTTVRGFEEDVFWTFPNALLAFASLGFFGCFLYCPASGPPALLLRLPFLRRGALPLSLIRAGLAFGGGKKLLKQLLAAHERWLLVYWLEKDKCLKSGSGNSGLFSWFWCLSYSPKNALEAKVPGLRISGCV